MDTEKTAQLNWFRKLRDRFGKKTEGADASYNEQELRNLMEREQNVTSEEERIKKEDIERGDRLVREKIEESNRLGLVPNQIPLSYENINLIFRSDDTSLRNMLCGSYFNCSPMASETGRARNEYITQLIYNLKWNQNNRVALGFLLKMFESMEDDLRQAGNNNRIKAQEISKENFIEKFALLNYPNYIRYNRSRILQLIDDAKHKDVNTANTLLLDTSVAKNADEYLLLCILSYAGIEFISQFIKNLQSGVYFGMLDDIKTAAVSFFHYIRVNENLKQRYSKAIFEVMEKRYLPTDSHQGTDAVHHVARGLFERVADYDTFVAMRRGGPFAKMTVEEWSRMISDMWAAFDASGLDMQGKRTNRNISGQDLFSIISTKLKTIDNIINSNPDLAAIFKKYHEKNESTQRLELRQSKKIAENNNLYYAGNLHAAVTAYRYYNGIWGVSKSPVELERDLLKDAQKEIESADYERQIISGAATLPSFITLALGANPSLFNDPNYVNSVKNTILKIIKTEIDTLNKVLENPDEHLDYDPNAEDTEKNVRSLLNVDPNRQFGEEELKKSKEQKILDSPFEHSASIRFGIFPGQGAFSSLTQNYENAQKYFPRLSTRILQPASFQIVIFPKKEMNENPLVGEALSPQGLNFHHNSMFTISREGHHNYGLGWVGGYVDNINKNMYIVELQSDVMQFSNFMKDPIKAKKKINEDYLQVENEIKKEKENLNSQSAMGIDAFYDKKIKELEEKRDKAQNEQFKKQMDIAIEKLQKQKEAKEDPWKKIRQKIEELEKHKKEIEDQYNKLLAFETDSRNHWKKKPNLHDVRSKIENKFSEWIDVFYNEIFSYSARFGIKNIYIITSEGLKDRWGALADAGAVEVYKKIYDKRAQEFKGEFVQTKLGKWWHLDLTKNMPKYAKVNWYKKVKNAMV